MTTYNPLDIRRGQYRFWHPIDHRYELYSWPNTIIAKCSGCGEKLIFNAIRPENYERTDDGGYRVIKRPISTEIYGHGACLKCGKQVESLHWPEDAYFQIPLAGGNAWAWNEKYLHLLRARVSGDRVLERHLCLNDGLTHYFLTRLPKNIVVKRNRERLLRKIDQFLGEAI